jgi:hypothetical protein
VKTALPPSLSLSHTHTHTHTQTWTRYNKQNPNSQYPLTYYSCTCYVATCPVRYLASQGSATEWVFDWWRQLQMGRNIAVLYFRPHFVPAVTSNSASDFYSRSTRFKPRLGHRLSLGFSCSSVPLGKHLQICHDPFFPRPLKWQSCYLSIKTEADLQISTSTWPT